MKNITMKFFFNCFDVFHKFFFKKTKKSNSVKISFLTMKNKKMSKKFDILKIVHRFYDVEISKTIVFLIE